MFSSCTQWKLKIIKMVNTKKKFEWNNLLRFAALNSGNKYVVKWVFEKNVILFNLIFKII